MSVMVEDLGDESPSPSGSAVVVRDKLPAGVTALQEGIEGSIGINGVPTGSIVNILCKALPGEVKCTVPAGIAAFWWDKPYSHFELLFNVKLSETVKSGEESEVTVDGGGAASVSVKQPLVVSAAPTKFGVEQYEMRAENADGSIDTQAGSHPFQLTTAETVNQTAKRGEPPAALKDFRFDVPPGLVGNPTSLSQCPLAKFLDIFPGSNETHCPDSTVVGVVSLTVAPSLISRGETYTVPLVALVPLAGEPARFGFDVNNVSVYLDTSVRTGSDYGVTVSVNNITEVIGFVSTRLTFWGVPGDPRHDSVRGGNCLAPLEGAAPCTPLGEESPPPLLTMPTSCDGPVHTTLEADSWEQEGTFTPPFEYTFHDNLGRVVGMDGCNQEPFSPSISVTPDGLAGSTPTGLTVGVHVPQDVSLNSNGLAEADVQNTTVTLPVGVALNPAAADGLQSCSLEQVALESPVPFQCPEAAKVGTVEVHTPLLANNLTGAVYLAAQNANPFGSLVALYVFLEDPVSGIRIKLAGEVLLDPVTGQLVSTFKNTPQLPFEDFKLHFFGGDRAPLGTPASCGAYTTLASVSPWSGNPPVQASSTFNITSGPER